MWLANEENHNYNEILTFIGKLLKSKVMFYRPYGQRFCIVTRFKKAHRYYYRLKAVITAIINNSILSSKSD